MEGDCQVQAPSCLNTFLLLLTPDLASKNAVLRKHTCIWMLPPPHPPSAGFIDTLPECTAAEMCADDVFVASAHLRPAAEICMRDESIYTCSFKEIIEQNYWEKLFFLYIYM